MSTVGFCQWLEGYLEDKPSLSEYHVEKIKKKMAEIQFPPQAPISIWPTVGDRVVFPSPLTYPWSQPTITCAVNNGAAQ